MLGVGSRSGVGLVRWPLVTLSRRSRGGIFMDIGWCDVNDAVQDNGNDLVIGIVCTGYLVKKV